MTKNLICMMGLPRSGKSTFVDGQFPDYQIVCPDDIRLALGVEFDKKIEDFVWGINNTIIRAYLIRERDVVIDATNTTKTSILKYYEMAKEYDYQFTIVFMQTTEKVCLERNEKSNKVPPDRIRRMKRQLDALKYSNFLDDFDVQYIS